MSRILFITLTLLALPFTALAAEEGTVIVEQRNYKYHGIDRLGTWGLSSAYGVINGESIRFTSTKPAGPFTLTVTPPDGATPTIDIHVDGELQESVQTRTTSGVLGSGGTLQFTITYNFDRLGTVGVTSTPTAIPFELVGPAKGRWKGVTDATFSDRVEGTYTVYYTLPPTCVIPKPIARQLDMNRRLSFNLDVMNCPALGTGGTPRPSPKPTPKPTPEKPTKPAPTPTPPRREVNDPVRVALSTASKEVTAGGTTRFTVVAFNRGETLFRDLTMDVRYDGALVQVADARGGKKENNRLIWTIPLLKSGEKWEQTFTASVNKSAENGTAISMTATLTGEELTGISVANRSDSVQVGVLAVLPPTGALWALDAMILVAFILGAILLLAGEATVVLARTHQNR